MAKQTQNPLYQDVKHGFGGITGGKFTFGGDTLTATSYDALIDSDGDYIVQSDDGAKILINRID